MIVPLPANGRLSKAHLRKGIRGALSLAQRYDNVDTVSYLSNFISKIDNGYFDASEEQFERLSRTEVRRYLIKGHRFAKKYPEGKSTHLLTYMKAFLAAVDDGKFELMTDQEKEQAAKLAHQNPGVQPQKPKTVRPEPEAFLAPQKGAQRLSVPFLAPNGIINTEPMEEW